MNTSMIGHVDMIILLTECVKYLELIITKLLFYVIDFQIHVFINNNITIHKFYKTTNFNV